MVSLISKVVRSLEEDRRGSVSLVIEVADDLDEVSFLTELEDLARKYGKEVKIACDVLTEEDLIDLEADRYYDRLKDGGKMASQELCPKCGSIVFVDEVKNVRR